MKLEQSLCEWDGKSTDQIGQIYDLYAKDDDFVSVAISLFENVDFQIGATWLLKKHLETGNTLDGKTVAHIYQITPSLVSWESQLHILQCVPKMPIAVFEKETAEEFFRNCLASKNKFVRAWAYGGFYLLADQFPEYRNEAKQFIENAMIEESASVKARIRNVIKKGFLAGR